MRSVHDFELLALSENNSNFQHDLARFYSDSCLDERKSKYRNMASIPGTCSGRVLIDLTAADCEQVQCEVCLTPYSPSLNFHRFADRLQNASTLNIKGIRLMQEEILRERLSDEHRRLFLFLENVIQSLELCASRFVSCVRSFNSMSATQ